MIVAVISLPLPPQMLKLPTDKLDPHTRPCHGLEPKTSVFSPLHHRVTSTVPKNHWTPLNIQFSLMVQLVHGIAGVKLEVSATNSPEKQRTLAKRNRKRAAIKQCAQLGQFCREQ